jgi:hypothetical protein
MCVLIYQNPGRFAGQCINIPWIYLEDVIVRLAEAYHHCAKNVLEEVEQGERAEAEIPLANALRKMEQLQGIREQTTSLTIKAAR